MHRMDNNHNTMIIVQLILFGILMFAVGGLAMFLWTAGQFT